MNFGLHNLFRFFCIVRGQKKFEKKYIYVPCDCVEFSICLNDSFEFEEGDERGNPSELGLSVITDEHHDLASNLNLG